MNYFGPIFTEKRQCQDCYKCVRTCPVKAIKIESGFATVIPEGCIYCGNCVTACPNNAKKVRDDLPRVRKLLGSSVRVIVSLAPSYVSAFPGVSAGQLVAALRRLGFHSVSETALGAQEVSARVAEMLADGPARVLISSACPTIVSYIQRHRPEYASFITPLLSPMLTHGKILKALHGPQSAVVFIGPCIAKKLEADAHPNLVDAALTFADLCDWLREENIDPRAIAATEADVFLPQRATDGALYAVDGGMIAGVRANAAVNDCGLMAFSGISSVQKALIGLEQLHPDRSILVELLACEGGCVNGPRLGRDGSTIAKRYDLLRNSTYLQSSIPRKATVPIEQPFAPAAVTPMPFSDPQLRAALKMVGKYSPDDELNCGGCGYDSCRDFGHALLSSKAERSQCVTYMRQLAHKKANALIQKMPSAVVIVDQGMKVVEHNEAFARLFGPAGARPGGPDGQAAALEGSSLAELLPFHRLFASVLRNGEDILDRDLRHRDAILHLSIFTIEKHAVVGAIIQDVTKPSVQKEQVIRKAQDVIRRNLETVQKIAYLLGENAAESEVTLNTIIDSFSSPQAADESQKPEQPDQRTEGHDWRKHYRR